MSGAINGRLLQRLEAAAQQGAKLYHASRVVLGVSPQLPPGGEPVPRWWSGVEPAEGWQAFLSAERVFEAREYERQSRWHQSCYHGAAERVNEYTLLAAEACGVLPVNFVLPRGDFHRGIHHVNRDAWSFFLYRLAAGGRAAFGLDVHGLPPYADFAFPGLETVVACTSTEPDREEQMLTRFRDQFHEGTGRKPEFVYAGLRLDVFSASVLGLRYLLENRESLYSPLSALDLFGPVPATEVEPPSAATSDVSGDNEGSGDREQRPTRPRKGRNEERDHWLYERCMAGDLHRVIREELERLAKSNTWYTLDDDQGIQQAAVRYAVRHQLPPPPRRRG